MFIFQIEKMSSHRKFPDIKNIIFEGRFSFFIIHLPSCKFFKRGLKQNIIFKPLGARCIKSCGWGGFSTFLRWRSRVFFNRTSLTPHQIFDARLLENTNLSPSELKILKKIFFDQELRKKMVNFKLNYGVHKVEKAWQNFPHSDWLVKIMTSWARRRRHENFGDVEISLSQFVVNESSRRRAVQSTRTKSLFTQLAMSVHCSATFFATGAWGVKEIIIYYQKNLIFLLFSGFYFNLQAVGRY